MLRRVLTLHKYVALLFPAVFVAELAFAAWAYTVGPAENRWRLVAGGLAGLIPSVLDAVALWLGRSGLRGSGRPDRLAAAVRTVTIAFWIGCFSWIAPLAVGLLLESDQGGGMFLIGIMFVIPLVTITMSIRTSRRRLVRARDLVPLGFS